MQNLGDEIVKLKTAQPYTNTDLNYNDPKSRVSREHNDASLRRVPLNNAKTRVGRATTSFLWAIRSGGKIMLNRLTSL